MLTVLGYTAGGWELLHIPLVYIEILTSFCACTFLLRERPGASYLQCVYWPLTPVLFHKCWPTHEAPALVREYTFVGGSSGLLLHGVFSRVTS